MRIFVYIDGFNLYYGSLKHSANKWLDVLKLSTLLFPKDEIVKIKYFTAPIKVRVNDADIDKPNRQQIYLRALRTIPQIEIIKGSFLTHAVMMKNADSQGFTKVVKTEEKGTDVNIAAHLVHDGHNATYDMAVVVSNDSDLVEPIRLVTDELHIPVIVLSPFEKNSVALKKTASGVRHLRQGVLRASQFPDNLSDRIGHFRKPLSW